MERLASFLASHHARYPRSIIFVFVVSCSLVTVLMTVLFPTPIYTDVKTIVSRGTDIAGRDKIVEALQREKEPPLRSGSTLFQTEKQKEEIDTARVLVSFLFETLDPSENIFDTPYVEFLCQIREVIKEILSWNDACQVVAGAGGSSGNCTVPLSVIDLPEYFSDKEGNVNKALKQIIRKSSSKRSASFLAGGIKRQCISSGSPKCSVRGLIGCESQQCGSTCKVEGFDICHLLEILDPSEEELLSLAYLDNAHSPDANGCGTNEFSMSSLHRLLAFFNTVVAFGERISGDADAQGLIPLDGGRAFVSRDAALAAKDGKTMGQAMKSHITRIVFLVDYNEVPEHIVAQFVQEAGNKSIKLAAEQGLRASWGHYRTFEIVVEDALLRDAKRSMFAALFVTSFVLWQTQSLLLTGGAMICVIGSIPISLWIYRFIFDIHWTGFVTGIALFLTVGIGVDDVFVMLNYWKGAPSSLHHKPIEHRLTWALEHSIISMGVTSVTTAVAFCANMLSPIPPVRLFGAIMAILVVVNYILVLLVFPSFIVLAEEGVDRSTKNSLYSRIATSDSKEDAHHDEESEEQLCSTEDSEGIDDDQDATSSAVTSLPSVLIDWIVTNAEQVACGAAVMLAILSYMATHLQGPDALLNFFDENHNMQRYFKMEQEFDGTGALIQPAFVWGAIPKDIVDKHDPLSVVPIQLDDSIDLENKEAQQWLLDLCNDLSSPNRPEVERVLPGSLRCFHLDLHRWLEAEARTSSFNGTILPRGLPVPEEQWGDVVTSFLHSSASSAVMERATGGGIWFEENNTSSGRASVLVISFSTRTVIWKPWRVLHEEREHWDSWLKKHLETAPTGLKNGFLGSLSDQWSMMEALRLLTPTSKKSTMASAVSAFCILLVGTRSFQVTLVALLCISGVLVSFLAFMVMSGWSVNMMESCCIALVFGISVDYISHVAIGYVNAPNNVQLGNLASLSDSDAKATPDKQRDESEQRCRYALEMVGSAVLSGMVTTVGASAFLWGCEVLILARFGIFVAFTLITTFLVATIVFPSITISLQLHPGCVNAGTAR